MGFGQERGKRGTGFVVGFFFPNPNYGYFRKENVFSSCSALVLLLSDDHKPVVRFAQRKHDIGMIFHFFFFNSRDIFRAFISSEKFVS